MSSAGSEQKRNKLFCYYSYAPVKLKEGGLHLERYTPHVLVAITEKVADNIATNFPEVAQGLREEADQFLRTTDESARRASFASLMRLMSVVGDFGGDVSVDTGGTGSTGSTGGTVKELDQFAAALFPEAAARPQACRASLVELLRSGDLARMGDVAEECLKRDPGHAAHVDQLARFEGCIVKGISAQGLPGGEKLRSVMLSAQYVAALNVNTFFSTLLSPQRSTGAASPSREALTRADIEGALDPQRTDHQAVAELLHAGEAFQSNPSAANCLALANVLSKTDGEAVRSVLDAALAQKVAGSGKSGAEADALRTMLQDETTELCKQFDLLREHQDVFYYGAHALYGLETGIADPYDIRGRSPANAQFLLLLQEKLDPKGQERALKLMKDGLRGDATGIATAAALASLKATGLHSKRQDVYRVLGAEVDNNIRRALRYERKLSGQDDSYSLKDLIADFLTKAAANPTIQHLETAHSKDVTDAQAFQSQVIAAELDELRMTPEQVRHIQGGVDVRLSPSADALKDQNGQTAGFALMALTRVLINSINDIDSETMQMLTGGPVAVNAENHYELSNDALVTTLTRAAAMPLRERETAVLLSEYMLRTGKSDIDTVIKALEPQPPKPESLVGLSEDEATARQNDYELAAARFIFTAEHLRSAWKHHSITEKQSDSQAQPQLQSQSLPQSTSQSQGQSENSAPQTSSRLAVFNDQEAYALLQALRDPVRDKTLNVKETKEEHAAIRSAYDALLASFAPTSKKSGTQVKTSGASVTPNESREMLTRTLMATLTPARFDRGRYVLLTKVHDSEGPSSTAEFDKAWKKLGIDEKKLPGAAALKASLTGETTVLMGSIGREALSATGVMEGKDIAAFLADNKDPAASRLFLTANHAALELTAASIGKSADSIAMFDPRWKQRVRVEDIQVRPDQTALKQLLEGKAPDDTVALRDIYGANLKAFLPEAAAEAYMKALFHRDGDLAAVTSRSLFLRNQAIRKSKYFEGLLSDLNQAITKSSDFSTLRGKRAETFHLRQQAQFSELFESVAPGTSIVLDKNFKMHLLSVGLSAGISRNASNENLSAQAKGSLEASLGIDLADAVVCTKNTDGTLTVGVTKAVELQGKATASGSLGVSAKAENSDLKMEASINAQASLGVNAGLGYALTVERTMSPSETGVFFDKLISRQLSADSLNTAQLRHDVKARIGFTAEVGVGAALGFETQEGEKKTVSETTSTDENGNQTTETVKKDDEGNTETTVKNDFADGSSLSTTTVRDKEGNFVSKETTQSVEGGGTVTHSVEKSALSLPFEDGLADPAGLLNLEAKASANAAGEVEVMRSEMNTETEKTVTLGFTGSVSLGASVSASAEGLSTLGDLIDKDLSFEKSTSYAFNVTNEYSYTESKTSGFTTSATKDTVCSFEAKTPPKAFEKLLRAQGLSDEARAAVLAFVATTDLAPNEIEFHGRFNGELAKRTLGLGEICKPANYRTESITLVFSESQTTTSFVGRLVNLAGKALNNAFEVSSSASKRQTIEINVDSLMHVTPTVIRSVLDESSRNVLSNRMFG